MANQSPYNYATVTTASSRLSGHKSNMPLECLAGVEASAIASQINAAMREVMTLPNVSWDGIRSQMFDAYIEGTEHTGKMRDLLEAKLREKEAAPYFAHVKKQMECKA